MIINLGHCHKWLIIINNTQSSQILLKVKSWRHRPAIVKNKSGSETFFIWPCNWNVQTLGGVRKWPADLGHQLCVYMCLVARLCVCAYINYVHLFLQNFAWTYTIMYKQFLYFAKEMIEKHTLWTFNERTIWQQPSLPSVNPSWRSTVHSTSQKTTFYSFIHSWIHYAVLWLAHSLFQSEFSKLWDIMHPLLISSILWFP